MGNSCIVVPSETCPLSAIDLYQVFDTSDVPGGVVNIVTGRHAELAPTLAGHAGVDAVWHFSDPELAKTIEEESAANLKRTWVRNGQNVDWLGQEVGREREFLRQATEIKNIWIPYGD